MTETCRLLVWYFRVVVNPFNTSTREECPRSLGRARVFCLLVCFSPRLLEVCFLTVRTYSEVLGSVKDNATSGACLDSLHLLKMECKQG